ncbi:MAG TPA: universal stress protein, partial [Casimicrobiaceae bacterium]|nr:universal stress protein [Casimicrobiaceae bacterium]
EPDVPPWLQEVILRNLEKRADDRYQTAAHVALDLRNPEQVERSVRSERITAPGFFQHVGHWWRGRRRVPERVHAPPGPAVIMVAVDTEHPDDERHSPLQWTTGQIVSLNPEFRLMCVSIIRSAPVGEGSHAMETTTGKHLEHKARLRHWVEPLRLPPSRVSLHVVEAVDAAGTLVDLARANHVGLIVLGAPAASRTRIGWWRSAASTVTADAPCSVHVVRVPERRSPR